MGETHGWGTPKWRSMDVPEKRERGVERVGWGNKERVGDRKLESNQKFGGSTDPFLVASSAANMLSSKSKEPSLHPKPCLYSPTYHVWPLRFTRSNVRVQSRGMHGECEVHVSGLSLSGWKVTNELCKASHSTTGRSFLSPQRPSPTR